MIFSSAKMTTLRPQKEKKLATFAIALITVALFFVPYIIADNGYFLFFGDFNVQQIPFYQACHQAIKTGNINWSWTTDLGSNFIGSYSFYLLGSPFFWLTIPFSNSVVPYLMGPLLILKFGCAAFTAYLYIRRFTKTPQAAQIGALLYAFSGFSVYNIFFNHFHEALIVFPLLLLALELLITENRRGVFALAVTLSAIVNYFFFFGMVVFCIIYFFVRVCSRAVKVRFSRFLVLVFEAVIGLLMAAILLLPSIYAIIGNGRISSFMFGWSAIAYGKEQIYLNVIQCFFFPPDLPARPVFFPGAEVKWSSLGGWLPVFGMTGVITWLIAKKGTWIKRIIAICAFMAMVPVLNSAFYAFNTAYYARWFYMPILMMCLATAVLTEDREIDWMPGFKWTAAITAAFAIVIGFFPQKTDKDEIIFGLYTQDKDGTYLYRFWIAVMIAGISLIILYVLLRVLRKNRTAFYRAATVFICIVSVVYANIFIACGRSHSYDIKNVMIDRLIEGNVDFEDDSEYRIDVYNGVDNTGMYLGYPCINAFHSVVPASIIEFYESIGVERSVGSRPETDIPAIRSLLSVKYLINPTDAENFLDDDNNTRMPNYKYLKTEDGYYVYENENYIPYGFSYDYYMSEKFFKSYGDESKTRLLLKAMLLSKEQINKYSSFMTDIDTLKDQDYLDVEENDNTTLSLSDTAMQEDCERLSRTSAISFSRDNEGFTAKVERENKSLVFFSVPYDEGWKAYVNDEKAEIEKVNSGFMAVPVNEGTSTIRFKYETPGLMLGAEITVGALLVFLVYYIVASVFVRNHPSNTEYPEGENLLKKWHEQDLDEATHHYMHDDEKEEKPDILDDIPEISINSFKDSQKFNGGFYINTDSFDDNNKD